ncbi:MAG: hypothetical protein HYT08_03740 [Candidatus Levybacteria bacterium]|nr:hypothetical protein [Candidatus Levybacteria bacterium]
MIKSRHVTKPIYDSPLVDPREKILLRRRQHWFPLILSIFSTVLLSFLLMGVNFFVFLQFFPENNLFLTLNFVILLSALTIISKLIADWHCHFYLLTNRRVLEVSYKPLFASSINNVILNQVKSTEIDIEKKGFINQILDIGNVLITFDRPTHQEEFCFMNVKDPKSVGFLLADVLDMNKAELDIMVNPIWYRPRNKEKPYRITQEIFPGGVAEAL